MNVCADWSAKACVKQGESHCISSVLYPSSSVQAFVDIVTTPLQLQLLAHLKNCVHPELFNWSLLQQLGWEWPVNVTVHVAYSHFIGQ